MARILIVDADQSILRMLRLVLQTSGFEVRAASNARDAGQTLRSYRPDAVILDLRTADRNREFVEALCARRSRVAVIVTGGQWRSDRARIPLVTFVPKPFRPDAILAAVEATARPKASPRALRRVRMTHRIVPDGS